MPAIYIQTSVAGIQSNTKSDFPKKDTLKMIINEGHRNPKKNLAKIA